MPSTAQQMADPRHWGSNLPQVGDFDTWQAYQKALRGAYQDYRQSPGGERLGVATKGTWREGNAPTAGSAAADAFQQAYERANQEGVTSAANGLAMRSRAGVRPDEAQMAYDAWKLDPTTGEASPLLKSNVLAALEQMGFRPPEVPPPGGYDNVPVVPTMPGPGQPQHPTLQQLNPVAYDNAYGTGALSKPPSTYPTGPGAGGGESPLGPNGGYLGTGYTGPTNFGGPITQYDGPGLNDLVNYGTSALGPTNTNFNDPGLNALLTQYQQMQQQGGQVPGAPMPSMDQINLNQFDPYSMGQLPPAQAQQLIQDPKNYSPQVFAAIQRLQGGQRRPVY